MTPIEIQEMIMIQNMIITPDMKEIQGKIGVRDMKGNQDRTEIQDTRMRIDTIEMIEGKRFLKIQEEDDFFKYINFKNQIY